MIPSVDENYPVGRECNCNLTDMMAYSPSQPERFFVPASDEVPGGHFMQLADPDLPVNI